MSLARSWSRRQCYHSCARLAMAGSSTSRAGLVSSNPWRRERPPTASRRWRSTRSRARSPRSFEAPESKSIRCVPAGSALAWASLPRRAARRRPRTPPFGSRRYPTTVPRAASSETESKFLGRCLIKGVSMPKAIRFHQPGGPEVLVWEDIKVGDPGPGEVRVRHSAVGVNYIDIYHRTGLYKLTLPSGIGMEGAGVVEAVGPGVTELKTGDRVGYASPIGSYSEVRLAPADRLVRLPDAIAFETAAGMMLKGMTVQYLIKRTFKVQPGM